MIWAWKKPQFSWRYFIQIFKNKIFHSSMKEFQSSTSKTGHINKFSHHEKYFSENFPFHWDRSRLCIHHASDLVRIFMSVNETRICERNNNRNNNKNVFASKRWSHVQESWIYDVSSQVSIDQLFFNSANVIIFHKLMLLKNISLNTNAKKSYTRRWVLDIVRRRRNKITIRWIADLRQRPETHSRFCVSPSRISEFLKYLIFIRNFIRHRQRAETSSSNFDRHQQKRRSSRLADLITDEVAIDYDWFNDFIIVVAVLSKLNILFVLPDGVKFMFWLCDITSRHHKKGCTSEAAASAISPSR